MDVQFYPTPPELAKRAWAKFKNQDFVRVLEPSAGEGDLLEARPHDHYSGRGAQIDCIEIDVTKHPILREKFGEVVGVDFLQFTGAGAQYSHVLTNPPFANGAAHVLKAWDLVYDAEIVAIINADTVRNPFSKERQLLVKLIEQHGEVEFIEGAFTVEEAERKTEVDVALVWLKKQAPIYTDLLGDIMDGLKQDERLDTLAEGRDAQKNELVVPASFIENSVINFNAAVEAMRRSVFAEARYAFYEARMGKSLEEMNADKPQKDTGTSLEFVQRELHERYKKLKSRAWGGIVRSTEVVSKLSSEAQRRLESEIEKIKTLEFTESNVYGLLQGLIAKRGEIQGQMMLDVFDLFSKWHTDNTHFYMGWKSNDAHRKCGMRLKTTRFVLPRHNSSEWGGFSFETRQLASDLDKVFALLDSKAQPAISLAGVLNMEWKDLRAGKRLSSSYFDVRHYKGIGTLHLFPRNKDLVDRLNRYVGRIRKWLPPEGEKVSKEFWLQFNQADKFDAEIREEAMKNRRSRWDDPFHGLFWKDDQGDLADRKLAEAIATVLERHGIDPVAMLEAPESVTLELPLLAA